MGQSTEGVTSHTEEFHIYSVGIEGPFRAECIHISILETLLQEWKRGCGVRDRTYFYNLGEKLNVSGPT